MLTDTASADLAFAVEDVSDDRDNQGDAHDACQNDQNDVCCTKTFDGIFHDRILDRDRDFLFDVSFVQHDDLVRAGLQQSSLCNFNAIDFDGAAVGWRDRNRLRIRIVATRLRLYDLMFSVFISGWKNDICRGNLFDDLEGIGRTVPCSVRQYNGVSASFRNERIIGILFSIQSSCYSLFFPSEFDAFGEEEIAIRGYTFVYKGTSGSCSVNLEGVGGAVPCPVRQNQLVCAFFRDLCVRNISCCFCRTFF